MAALDRFSPVARAWFESAFEAPTDAQDRGWEAISRGDHTLILAPTGSGKTLAAFLWALDRLVSEPPVADAKRRLRVLYVSPLKALTYDVERNLRAPLAGMAMEAGRRGLPAPDVRVGIRTGDTSQSDRRDIVRHPPDVLVTTPESLYLMLTSGAREVLRSVEYVIVDEIHSVAATKRGAHLALSLERLERLTDRPPQRIGLSATQRPLDEVARFLGGRERDPATGEWRRPAGGGGRRRGAQAAGAGGHRPRRRHGRAGQGHPRRAGGAGRGRPRGPHLDLARHPPRPPRPHPHPHVHPDLRELPPPGRAAGGPAQRPGRRGAGAGPPRVDRPRAAARHRGPAEGGQAAGPGGHVEPGAGHRHGRHRPGGAGGGAAVGGQRAAAHRPGRAPGGAAVGRQDLPQVPGRPGGGGGDRGPDGAGADRGDQGPPQPARRAGPADRGHVRGRRRDGRRGGRHGRRRLPVLRPVPAAAGERARHAGRALPVRRLRRAAAADRVGPGGGPAAGPAGSADAVGGERGDDPRPGPVRRLHPRGVEGGRARRGVRLREPAGRDDGAGRDHVAHRGHHPRPGGGHARAGRAGEDAVLARRQRGPAGGAGPGHRGVPAGGRRLARLAAGRGLLARRRWRSRTCGPTWTRSGRSRAACCPPTARSWSSASATSWATGGCACCRPSGDGCTPRGRWPSRPGCATGWGSRCRRCGATTASSSACPRPTRRPPSTWWSSTPTRSRSWWWASWPTRPCSLRGSGRTRPGRCCCPGAGPANARRCGRCGSGRPTCWRWRRSTASSRSSWRRTGSACATSSTCPR